MDTSDAGNMPEIDELRVTPIDRTAVGEIITWRYPPPYDLYNIGAQDAEVEIDAYLDPAYQYYQMRNETGELVAFFNFGVDARVPGGDYSPEALDIGLGVHPDWTGSGYGSIFVQAVLRFARQQQAPVCYRVTIAGFNRRAQRVWQKAGFSEVQKFQRPKDGMNFLIFTADADEIVWID